MGITVLRAQGGNEQTSWPCNMAPTLTLTRQIKSSPRMGCTRTAGIRQFSSGLLTIQISTVCCKTTSCFLDKVNWLTLRWSPQLPSKVRMNCVSPIMLSSLPSREVVVVYLENMCVISCSSGLDERASMTAFSLCISYLADGL